MPVERVRISSRCILRQSVVLIGLIAPIIILSSLYIHDAKFTSRSLEYFFDGWSLKVQLWWCGSWGACCKHLTARRMYRPELSVWPSCDNGQICSAWSRPFISFQQETTALKVHCRALHSCSPVGQFCDRKNMLDIVSAVTVFPEELKVEVQKIVLVLTLRYYDLCAISQICEQLDEIEAFWITGFSFPHAYPLLFGVCIGYGKQMFVTLSSHSSILLFFLVSSIKTYLFCMILEGEILNVQVLTGSSPATLRSSIWPLSALDFHICTAQWWSFQRKIVYWIIDKFSEPFAVVIKPSSVWRVDCRRRRWKAGAYQVEGKLSTFHKHDLLRLMLQSYSEAGDKNYGLLVHLVFWLRIPAWGSACSIYLAATSLVIGYWTKMPFLRICTEGLRVFESVKDIEWGTCPQSGELSPVIS